MMDHVGASAREETESPHRQDGRVRAPGSGWPVLLPAAGMLIAILTVLAVRIRLLDVPLERDEGEYAYIGQLMLQGIAPYRLAANMKLPGTHAAYALIMAVFGQTTSGIHLGFLLVNMACIVLVYFLARRFFGWLGGLAAAAGYAVLSVGAGFDGLWAHATHFVVLFALGATILLLKWRDRPRILLLIGSGLLYGVAFLMKQQGILFALFGGLYLIGIQRKQWRSHGGPAIRNLAVFAGAAALPFGITCVLLWRAGVFDKFWFWVFTYASRYVLIRPLSAGVADFEFNAGRILGYDLALCGLAAVGLYLLWRDERHRRSALTITGFLAFSGMAVCPGLYFRPHYFVLMLPAVALLIGAVAAGAKSTLAGSIPLWLILAGLAYSMVSERDYLFLMSPYQVAHSVYGTDPFPEAIPIANYIRAHTDAEDRIVVLGSEPEIYFYSHRQAATPYLYVYPLTEPQPLGAQMREEFVDEVEAWKPKYLVFVNTAGSWGFHIENSTRVLLDWGEQYYRRNYDEVGIADISDGETTYKWDGDAVNYRAASLDTVVVFKRKEADR